LKPKIFLDTSVISALFDGRTPERQAQTNSCWAKLSDYEVFLSETVLQEIGAAPVPLHDKMLAAVSGFTVLPITGEAEDLARAYIEQGIFPQHYFDDALHVAVATTNQISILLSWNFTHLVKLKTRRMVAWVNARDSLIQIEIISPPEL
jgi:predicted nucleic acid-binding protein